MVNNFEYKKLFIENPELINTIVLLAVLVFSIICTSKKDNIDIFDVDQTNQAKGLAILLIIIGHFWVHIASIKPQFIFSGEGVALFLLLSGFGLTRSHLRKKHTLKDFFIRRLKRVFIPYWSATLIILFLDYIFLKRNLSVSYFFQTVAGINIYEATKRLDYVRWYITFLLFWYILFCVSTILTKQIYSICLLFIVAFLSLILDYYYFHLGWYQFFAFPLGCLLGFKYNFFKRTALNYQPIIPWICLLCLTIVLVYYVFFAQIIINKMPYIIHIFCYEIISIFFTIFVLLSFVYIGFYHKISILFSFLGGISYELFLLHGPFLIKYNFFIHENHHLLTIPLYGLFIILFSLFFKKSLTRVFYNNVIKASER